jgi:hypothetical protein
LISSKKELIRQHLLKYSMSSDRKIAELLGCVPKEVNLVRRDMLDSGEIRLIDADRDLAIDEGDWICIED